MELIRFTNSGTEANLMAVATALAFTGRRRVLVFEGAYHGSMLNFSGAASPVNVPHDFLIMPYNDTGAARAAIRLHAGEIACVLVEPMLGSGGCVPGDPSFLHALTEEARAAGAVLIFDEIQTSRLSIGGRQALLGIARPHDPRQVSRGRIVFRCIRWTQYLMALYDPRRAAYLPHAGTFNNNVLSMSAGYAALSGLITAPALDALNARGEALRAELNCMLSDCGALLAVRGLGSLMNFYAQAPAAGNPAFGAEAIRLMFFELLERGYYCAPRGFIALSLVVDDEIVRGFLDAMRDILRDHAPLLRGSRRAGRRRSSIERRALNTERPSESASERMSDTVISCPCVAPQPG